MVPSILVWQPHYSGLLSSGTLKRVQAFDIHLVLVRMRFWFRLIPETIELVNAVPLEGCRDLSVKYF